jgi:hypothetical protein
VSERRGIVVGVDELEHDLVGSAELPAHDLHDGAQWPRRREQCDRRPEGDSPIGAVPSPRVADPGTEI